MINMSFIKNIFFLLILLFGFTVQAQIYIDGNFDDWQGVPVMTDPIGDDGVTNIDFGEIQISNDDQNLYVRFTVNKEINLQSDNSLRLSIDTDNNVSTGTSYDGMGVDLRFDFGDRDGNAYLSNGNFEVYHTDIGLISAKTVTDEVFEFSLDRTKSIEGQALFSGNTIRISIADQANSGDKIPDNSGGIFYTFTDNDVETKQYYLQKSPESDLRVMSFNVLQDGLFDNGKFTNFKRIFRATRPDIIGFQEIYDHSSGLVADKIEAMMPNENGEVWYDSDLGPDIHCISRFPILQSIKVVGSSNSQGNGAFLIDLPFLNEDLLLIVAHLPCCENNYGRQQEVDAIMAFIRNAKNGSGPINLDPDSPIMIIGDMNFVGDSQNLQTLLDGNIIDESEFGSDFTPDWDGTGLDDLTPYTTDTPAAFTWYSEYSSYGPGRIDLMLYTGSQMVADNSYALFTKTMLQDTLLAYELYPNDVGSASDHLPIIGDFSFNNAIPVALKETDNALQFQLQPNPATSSVVLRYSENLDNRIEIKMFDNLGRFVQSLNHSVVANRNELAVNLENVASGTYFIQLIDGDRISIEKLIITK